MPLYIIVIITIKLGNCCSVDIYTRLNSLYFGESSNDHHHHPDQVLLFPLICQFDLPINDPISTSTRTSRFDRRYMSTDTVLSYYFGNIHTHQPYNVQFKRNNIPTYIEIKGMRFIPAGLLCLINGTWIGVKITLLRLPFNWTGKRKRRLMLYETHDT